MEKWKKLNKSQKISVIMVTFAMPLAVFGAIMNPEPTTFAATAMSLVCGGIVYVMADLL